MSPGLLSCLEPKDPQSSKSRRIDREIRKERKEIKRQVKILLLGSGESGKSTFLKQMVIIHGRGEFSAEEAWEYRSIIHQNIITGMRVLIDARKKLGIPWENPERDEKANGYFQNDATKKPVDPRTFASLYPIVQDLWADRAIRETWAQRSCFQINDSCQYFFEHLARIAQSEFVPSNRDILYSRRATKNILDHVFCIQGVPFRFIDVGGQRAQRQKWYQCFENGITSILFLTASSEYDQVLVEDRSKNRVLESRDVFETIVNYRSFTNVSVILFMNKTDLLHEKVPHTDIRLTFPEYKGDPMNIKEVQRFLLDLFDAARKNRTKPFYYHFTTAVDTENIRRVFQDVKDTILDQNLRQLMMQ